MAIVVSLALLLALMIDAPPASATSLAFAQLRPTLGFQPFTLRAGDIDGDGIADLVLGNGSRVAVARGNGDGTFQPPVSSPSITWGGARIGFGALAVGDVNADGRADVAVGPDRTWGTSRVKVLLGRADGSLEAARTFTSSRRGSPDDIAIADLNGDGHGDLTLAVNGGISGGFVQSGTTVSVLLSRGDGTFGAPSEFPANTGPTQVAVADLNDDGRRDVIVTNSPGTSAPDLVSVLLGTGTGALAAPLATPLRSKSAFNLVVADLNGDLRQDAAIAHTTGSASNGMAEVLLGNGDGSFTRVPRFRIQNVGTQGPLLATADFNRDGLGDLVVPGLRVMMQKPGPYQFSDDVYDPLNADGHRLGNGLFGLSELYTAPSTHRLTTADFDGDGWADIAAIGEEGDARTWVLTVLLNRTATMPVVGLASVTLDSSTLPGNAVGGGTVTLSAPAPTGGTIVELGSTTESFVIRNLPERVTIPAGQTSARFSFSAARLSAPLTVTIIAQLRDTTRTAPITISVP